MSSESVKRCLSPCLQLIPDDDPQDFCLECLREEHTVCALSVCEKVFSELHRAMDLSLYARLAEAFDKFLPHHVQASKLSANQPRPSAARVTKTERSVLCAPLRN